MEKIDGVNLEQWLQQQGNHPLNSKQAIAWLKQLAEIVKNESLSGILRKKHFQSTIT